MPLAAESVQALIAAGPDYIVMYLIIHMIVQKILETIERETKVISTLLKRLRNKPKN